MPIPIKQRTEITITKLVEMLKAQGLEPGKDIRIKVRKVDKAQLLEAEWTAPAAKASTK